jgi:hypothetical protein
MALSKLKLDGTTEENPPSLDSANWIDDMRVWPPILYGDIWNFLVMSEAVDGAAMKNFKGLESYQYFQSRHVGIVWCCRPEKEGKCVYLKTDVTPGQAVNKPNYKAWVRCDDDGTVQTGHCTCMAGLGKSCSHIGALLWKVEYAVTHNYTGTSCTDEQMKWNSGTQSNIEPKALEHISFARHKQTSTLCTTEVIQPASRMEFPQYLSHDEYVTCVNKSDLKPLFQLKNTTLYTSYTAQPFVQEAETEHDSEHCDALTCTKCVEFYTRYINITPEQTLTLERISKQQGESSIWKESRKIRITASTAHKVPVRATTNPDNFLRDHVYPRFTGNNNTIVF